MFNLEKPIRKFKLPKVLNEVSGISVMDKGIIAAVQDEHGVIYFIDSQNGKVTHEFAFGREGDYEGLAHTVSCFYVLESNGTIHCVERSTGEVRAFGFKGSKGFDFEGLCISPSGLELWVGCKTHKKKKMSDSVVIYPFDLTTMTYGHDPVFKIEKPKAFHDFRLSELCVRTKNELYLLSGNPAVLAIYQIDTHQCVFQELNPTIFKQPEGMSFDEVNRLWISNEKNGERANLLCFEEST